MSSIGASKSYLSSSTSRSSISNASQLNNRSFQSTSISPSTTLEQTSILNSIQRRVRERSTDETSPLTFDDSMTTRTIRRRGLEELNELIKNLENDLQLAATIGTCLLEEKGRLEREKVKLEGANNVLLDRVTAGTKESALLQRRLEQTISNLEQSDSTNRSLLTSLEEDRKTISRLSIDSTKLISTSSQLKSISLSLSDVREELSSSLKRAEKAERGMKKYGERVVEMEERLKNARGDIEAMRQEKVLRNKNSRDALAKVKARFNTATTTTNSRSTSSSSHASGENSEAAELMKVVESLVSENHLLRSESMELQGLLDSSRDEQSGLRLEMAEQYSQVLEEEEEEGESGEEVHQEVEEKFIPRRRGGHTRNSTPLNLRAELLSPSISHSSELRLSPSSTIPSSSCATHSPITSRRSSKTDFFETSNYDDNNNRIPVPTQHRRMSSNTNGVPALGITIDAGIIPFGRSHGGRRAVSVDVSSLGLRNGQTSPYHNNQHRDSPPPSRPLSLISNSNTNTTTSDQEDLSTLRKKHKPRPLSLSLGPSLFPTKSTGSNAIEDGDRDRDRNGDRERNSPSPRPSSRLDSNVIDPPPPSSRGPPPPFFISPSSNNTSPTKVKRSTGNTPSLPPISIPKVVEAPRDFSTQTSPTSFLFSNSFSSSSRPSSITASRSQNDSISILHQDLNSITTSSEISEDREKDFPTSSSSFSSPHLNSNVNGSAGPVIPETRTAALGILIDYISKLLLRIQNSDISSQENRLKKQNLLGNVGHLARANLRDLLADIEGLRGHFRRLLEQERAASARQINSTLNSNSTSTGSTSESQVESLIVRKDFVDLVKLFRDLLFETSRLRSLVNQIELEPSLASSLRELDILDTDRSTSSSTTSNLKNSIGLGGSGGGGGGGGGLLAPLSRIVGTFLGEPSRSQTNLQPSQSTLRQPSRGIATTKLSGSSGITSATVEVEFGKGASKQAVTLGGSTSTSISSGVASNSLLKSSTSSRDSIDQSIATSTITSSKSGSQVKRDLNNIFAGTTSKSSSSFSASTPTSTSSWVVLSSRTNTPSSNPFGRLLSNYNNNNNTYKPSKSSTAYAVLDSIPHRSSQVEVIPQDSLLERTLRPRGLSDSSIRSTYLTHANPHHRIISPVTLALSSEITINIPVEVQSGLSSSLRPVGELKRELNSLSVTGSTTSVGNHSTISRKASMNRLRSKPSSMTIRSSSNSSSSKFNSNSTPAPTSIVPPPPPLPISISISPSSSPSNPSSNLPPLPSSNTTSTTTVLNKSKSQQLTDDLTPSQSYISLGTGGGGVGSLFGNFSSWASNSNSNSNAGGNGTYLPPSTIGEGPRGERERGR